MSLELTSPFLHLIVALQKQLLLYCKHKRIGFWIPMEVFRNGGDE